MLKIFGYSIIFDVSVCRIFARIIHFNDVIHQMLVYYVDKFLHFLSINRVIFHFYVFRLRKSFVMTWFYILPNITFEKVGNIKVK